MVWICFSLSQGINGQCRKLLALLSAVLLRKHSVTLYVHRMLKSTTKSWCVCPLFLLSCGWYRAQKTLEARQQTNGSATAFQTGTRRKTFKSYVRQSVNGKKGTFRRLVCAAFIKIRHDSPLSTSSHQSTAEQSPIYIRPRTKSCNLMASHMLVTETLDLLDV